MNVVLAPTGNDITTAVRNDTLHVKFEDDLGDYTALLLLNRDNARILLAKLADAIDNWETN